MSKISRVIALGFFDGIHLGHAELIRATKKRAEEFGVKPSVLSFDVHPDTVVFKKKVSLINSAKERESIIKRQFDIDEVLIIHFNETIMHMPWDEFAKNMIDEFGAVWFVVGDDFTFGDKGQGNAKKLKEYCEARNLGCDIISPVKKEDIVVSSTYIRSLIENGEMGRAREFLGHPHFTEDIVRSGYHLGRELGAPTINLHIAEDVIVPKFGVYATKVYIDETSEYLAVTNVGVRPTVSDSNVVSVESHIIDFSGNLYGHEARVEYYDFLRPEQKFDNFEMLMNQIHKDTENTIMYFK